MMKRFLLIALASVAVASCLSDTFMEMNLTSISDFEFSDAASGFGDDSIYVENGFAGGNRSVALYFNSARDSENGPMTGGFGMTMKRDSSMTIAEGNLYPQYTRFETSKMNNNVSAVFYDNPDDSKMPEHDIVFTEAEYGTCTPQFCYISNTQQTVVRVKDQNSGFVEGDYIKLTATGFLNGKQTGQVEYYLADYRPAANGGEAPDSLLTSWKPLSLTKLGNVDNIDFDLESNKADFPLYFCLDNMVASIYIKR